MTRTRTTPVTCDIAVSVDGFVAGPNQSLDDPLGEGGEQLHRWMFEQPDAHTAELEHLGSAGAFIMGRNMFGPPAGGAWDESWHGWWGEDPPYHAPVFVLTHHPREPLVMQGGTTFTFVTDGIESALAQAAAAADGRVAIAGGAATVNQYLAAGLVDELWLHIAPITLGAGERLFDGLPGLALEPLETRHTDLVTHVRYRVVR